MVILEVFYPTWWVYLVFLIGGKACVPKVAPTGHLRLQSAAVKLGCHIVGNAILVVCWYLVLFRTRGRRLCAILQMVHENT
jgi:hypothetical protein